MFDNNKVGLRLTGKHIVTKVEKTFRFSNFGFSEQLTDDDMAYFYRPIIKDKITVKKGLDQSTGTLNFRIIRDDLIIVDDYIFEENKLEVFLDLPDGQGWFKVFSGYISKCLMQNHFITVTVKQLYSKMDKPCNPCTFTGIPDDFEGDANMKGDIKPMLKGVVFNITPRLIKPNQLIYGVNWDENCLRAPVEQFSAVYDGGLDLSFGSDYATTSTLDASTPSAGSYNTCLAEGTFKLGSAVVFQITVDVYNYYSVNGFLEEMEQRGYIECYQSNLMFSPSMGFYLEAEENCLSLFNQMVSDIDAFSYFDETDCLIVDSNNFNSGA
jgi:hypothetical protein